jgi:hypothetical protein
VPKGSKSVNTNNKIVNLFISDLSSFELDLTALLSCPPQFLGSS